MWVSARCLQTFTVTVLLTVRVSDSWVGMVGVWHLLGDMGLDRVFGIPGFPRLPVLPHVEPLFVADLHLLQSARMASRPSHLLYLFANFTGSHTVYVTVFSSGWHS